MKVSQLIEDLSKYDPEEELIVAYWDKEIVTHLSGEEITPEVWSEAVVDFSEREFSWQSDAFDCIVELIEEASA